MTRRAATQPRGSVRIDLIARPAVGRDVVLQQTGLPKLPEIVVVVRLRNNFVQVLYAVPRLPLSQLRA